jgi:diguanylate cyclase (GGDEF)-like protein
MEKTQALIIDDNRDVSLFYRTVLDMEGFTCDIANSAKSALFRLAVSQPEVVLLDMRLRSEIGGDDLLYQIRSNPRFDKTQVIVITAYPDMVEPVKHLADLVLYKPVEVDQLKELAGRLATVNHREKPYYFRDPITDLYNRQFFLTRLEQAVERARRREDFLFATLFFTFAMEEPDDDLASDERNQAMRQVAGRIRSSFRPTDTLARWQDDSFATLHEDLSHPDNVKVLMRRLQKEMQSPCSIGGRVRHLLPQFKAVLHSRQAAGAEDILTVAQRLNLNGDSPEYQPVQ